MDTESIEVARDRMKELRRLAKATTDQAIREAIVYEADILTRLVERSETPPARGKPSLACL